MSTGNKNHIIYVSDEAWSSLPRPRGAFLAGWPLAPVHQFAPVQRRRRCLVIPETTFVHLEAIAELSGLKSPYRTVAKEGLLGLAVEAIGQTIYRDLINARN